MDIENVDFMSACKLLAKRVGMEMPEFKSRRDGSQDVRRKKERLYEMMKDAARYYRSNFDGKEGAPAREYLAGRGIGENTARAFGIGYSTGYRGLVTKLKSLGYLEIEMVEAGLVDQRDGDVYDAMAGRLIVPIIDGMKRIIAFGGRVLVKDKLPKYKNTRDTILFDKSNELFGQDTVKRLRMTQPVNDLIVVEGYMDVISLWQAGVKNAVASMGTALTQRQAADPQKILRQGLHLLRRRRRRSKATVRGLDILHRRGSTCASCRCPKDSIPTSSSASTARTATSPSSSRQSRSMSSNCPISPRGTTCPSRTSRASTLSPRSRCCANSKIPRR